MSEYTSTTEGFQRAMKWSLSGPAGEANAYAAATLAPTFYHVMNGQREDLDAFITGLDGWRAKISDYEPVVDHFLRDGDKLAAHLTGTGKLEGADMVMESFIFAKVNQSSGKIEWKIERFIVGPPGQGPMIGAN